MEGPERLVGKKILIVDDELDVLETVEELLSGCLIDKAPSFETAVKFLNKNHYDGAIFDIMGVQGYELLRIATGKGVPVLMLTAHALSPENLIKSIKEGAQSYVPKDNLSQIAVFLGEMIEAHQKGIEKPTGWFSKLKPFFDRQFGPGWREKDQEFWRDFDSRRAVSKKDLQDFL